MKTEELRIGNLVNHISFEIVKIKGVNELSLKCQYEDNDYWDNKEYFNYIPLTEERLLRFGFERMNFLGVAINYLLKEPICISTADMVVEWDKPNFIIKQIKYVHELQNLYFALTGEELTLKTE